MSKHESTIVFVQTQQQYQRREIVRQNLTMINAFLEENSIEGCSVSLTQQPGSVDQPLSISNMTFELHDEKTSRNDLLVQSVNQLRFYELDQHDPSMRILQKTLGSALVDVCHELVDAYAPPQVKQQEATIDLVLTPKPDQDVQFNYATEPNDTVPTACELELYFDRNGSSESFYAYPKESSK